MPLCQGPDYYRVCDLGEKASSITHIYILFTSPNHLGNWQVTVTWKDKALKNPKPGLQKAENWLLSVRVH